jgi:hypothetical protein
MEGARGRTLADADDDCDGDGDGDGDGNTDVMTPHSKMSV